MDYEQHEKRVDAEIDRLSNLPDELIHKILSFVGIKRAIGLSDISSRWRYIWTSMPYLDFSVENFSTSARLSNFVTNVLSRRNNLVEVVSIKLHSYKDFSLDSLRQIMNYAFSHNVKQFDIQCFPENDNGPPLPFFYSVSLKHLSLRGTTVLTPTSIIELPALTSLYLKGITLSCDDNTENTDKCIRLFSKFANLKDLTLRDCQVIEGLLSLEKADLCVSYSIASAHEYVRLFQQLQCVKFLTLNMEILERLSSSVELISNQPSPFANLESLHIYPVRRLSEVRDGVKMSTEVKNYLLDNSPNATFTMVSREEIRDKENTELALKEMASLQVMLEREKTMTENRIIQVENLLQIGGSITHVNKSWEEAYDVVDKIMDYVKILFDLKRSRFRVYFDELSAISELLSKLFLHSLLLR
nr:hypothetical protein [Tanacetum cinerariifolium]